MTAALALMLALAAPQAQPASSAAPADAAGTLVVLNKAEASASLIDLASGQVAATLKTGEGPHEAAVSPDGRLALATNYGTREAPGASLTLLDIHAASVLKTLPLACRRPHGVVWLDGHRALVTCEDDQALALVNLDDARLEASIPTAARASHMVAATPDGRRAFVANIDSGSLTAIDLDARRVLAQIPTGAGAEGLDVSPDGREAWVTNREAGTLSVVDTASARVLATLEAPGFPIRVKLTRDGRHALVSLARAGALAVFDVAARRELRRVPLALDPQASAGRLFQDFGQSPVPIGIVIPPVGRRAYIACANADAIAILDLDTWTITGALRAGREPDGMAWSPLQVARVATSARAQKKLKSLKN